MDKFRISCSQISKLMSGSIYPTLTKELQGIIAKEKAGLKALTTLQQEKLDTYKKKLNKPELPQGAKTYIEDWYKGRLYGKRKEFSSKYTEKGNRTEKDAIDFIADVLDFGYLDKNTDRFYSEYIEGEPDVIIPEIIIDNKSSWDCFTFPLYEDKIKPEYWWQGQGYMILTKRKKYILAYTLMDMPLKMLNRLVISESRNRGMDDVTEELYLEMKDKYSYSHLADELRIKAYHFDLDPSVEEKIIERVKMARKYIEQELKPKYQMVYMKSINEVEKKLTLSDSAKGIAA